MLDYLKMVSRIAIIFLLMITISYATTELQIKPNDPPALEALKLEFNLADYIMEVTNMYITEMIEKKQWCLDATNRNCNYVNRKHIKNIEKIVEKAWNKDRYVVSYALINKEITIQLTLNSINPYLVYTSMWKIVEGKPKDAKNTEISI